MLKNKVIIYIIVFYIIYLGVLPFLITKTALYLCDRISVSSEYQITIKGAQARFSVLPYTKFKADNISIKSKNNIGRIEIENFQTKIRLLPLLSGKLHINNLAFDSLNISSDLKENVQLNKDFFEKLEHTKVLCDDLSVKKFETDLYQKDLKTPIVYSGENFTFQRKNKYVKLNLKSTLKAAGKASNADINLFLPKNNDLEKTIFEVDISNLDLAPFGTYFKHYLPQDLIKLEGFINVHANKGELVTELKDCKALMKTQTDSIILPSKLNIRSKFNIKRHYINFDNVDIQSQNINASFNGKIYDYFGKTLPTLDLNIQINPTKIEDVISLLPAFKIEEIDVHKLKQYKFYGNTIGNLSIKGRLPEPEINGDIFIDNGILTKPIPNTSKGATIKLNLVGKYVNFDVYVPAGGQEKVWVKGGQELYNVKYADMTIKSTKSVDLHIAESVVNPLHEILNFIIGPVPIMDIYGKGNIDIVVKGNRKNPHVWGIFNVSNSTVSFNEMPDLKLIQADASLRFNDQNAYFNTQKGYVNGKEFKLDGTCDLYGNFDFNAKTAEQSTEALYKAVQTSTLIPDIQKMLPKVDKITGTTDLDLKIYGTVKVIEDLKFNQNTFAKGSILIKNNNFTIQNMTLNNTSGKINFDGTNADASLTASIGSSPLSISAKIKNELGDISLNIPNFNPNCMIQNVSTDTRKALPIVSVIAKYKGNIHNIEYEKINLNSRIISSNPESIIKFKSGEINALNGKVYVKNLKGYIQNTQNSFQTDLRIDEAFTKNPEVNGNLKIKAPDVTLYNEILTSDLLPKNLKKYTTDYRFKNGKLDLDCKINKNKISGYTDLGGLSVNYVPLNLPINVINGYVSAKNSNVKLNKINILADKMPILLDGEIKDIIGKQYFNIYISSKPQQEFIEKYVNKNQIYPVKIKGDIVCWCRLKGFINNFEIKSNMNMNKDSSIYHYGATIGDVENAIVLDIDTKVINRNDLKIKEFSYDKLVDSQSGRQTRLNMLKAWGGTEILKDDLIFKDLHIKTSNPTDARIFNIIFRKPNIKQGQFTSDLRLNGRLSNPHILGDFHIFETNIPFLDTTMKNIILEFKERTVEISSKGEILGNDVAFEGTLKNKLTTPYNIEKATLYTQDLDLDNIINKIKISQVDTVSTFETFEGFDLNSVIFSNLKLKADKIQLRNINATNFQATASLNQKGIFDINNFNFNIAQGTLSGKYRYNLKNNDIKLDLTAREISANDITWAVFDLNNQIYGDMTGIIDLSCNGTNFQSCMQTLNGFSVFNVTDGKMPKLGSLEYLLKAGNLIKGGITSLSINSVIDIITPLKTGEFSDIYGKIRIKDGVARNIEIITKGKNLSLFIGGTYNFSTSIADMEVLGILSKKISTMFGPIGNMSINTLFNVIPGVDLSKDNPILEKINRIPGIEFSSKDYRKFMVEIKGNINGDDYVTSFKWIN